MNVVSDFVSTITAFNENLLSDDEVPDIRKQFRRDFARKMLSLEAARPKRPHVYKSWRHELERRRKLENRPFSLTRLRNIYSGRTRDVSSHNLNERERRFSQLPHYVQAQKIEYWEARQKERRRERDRLYQQERRLDHSIDEAITGGNKGQLITHLLLRPGALCAVYNSVERRKPLGVFLTDLLSEKSVAYLTILVGVWMRHPEAPISAPAATLREVHRLSRYFDRKQPSMVPYYRAELIKLLRSTKLVEAIERAVRSAGLAAANPIEANVQKLIADETADDGVASTTSHELDIPSTSASPLPCTFSSPLPSTSSAPDP